LTDPQPAPVRIRVEHLRIKANVTAGMNYLRIGALAYQLRGTTEEPEPPIEVVPDGDGWRIDDGRHRYFAAVIAGRPDVLCIVRPVEAGAPTA
jgi:hypothetical protein